MSIEPFRQNRKFVPDYYKPIHPLPRNPDWLDIAMSYGLDQPLTMALGYILRAGRKPREPRNDALTKTLEMVNRSMKKEIWSGRARSRKDKVTKAATTRPGEVSQGSDV